MAYVVAVSGISGSGKTSVIRRAIDLLGDAVALYFDDYAADSTYPGDLKGWIERGADVDEWRTPALADAVRRLRGDASGVVLVEEPFGKLRREMAGLIDLAVYLEAPGDVLLTRRLLREIEERRDVDRLIERLRHDLTRHLDLGRELDAFGASALRDSADVVVDATKSVDEVAAEVVSEIRRRR